MENSIIGKYKIDLGVLGLISIQKLNEETDEFEEYTQFSYDISKHGIKDAYVTLFTKLDDNSGSLAGKVVQYTDINGIDSENVISDEAYEVMMDGFGIKLDEPYIYIKRHNIEDETLDDIYVKLPDEELIREYNKEPKDGE